MLSLLVYKYLYPFSFTNPAGNIHLSRSPQPTNIQPDQPPSTSISTDPLDLPETVTPFNFIQSASSSTLLNALSDSTGQLQSFTPSSSLLSHQFQYPLQTTPNLVNPTGYDQHLSLSSITTSSASSTPADFIHPSLFSLSNNHSSIDSSQSAFSQYNPQSQYTSVATQVLSVTPATTSSTTSNVLSFYKADDQGAETDMFDNSTSASKNPTLQSTNLLSAHVSSTSSASSLSDLPDLTALDSFLTDLTTSLHQSPVPGPSTEYSTNYQLLTELERNETEVCSAVSGTKTAAPIDLSSHQPDGGSTSSEVTRYESK